jgi:hypothetical protein
MADNRLSEQFDALSDNAKETANKVRAAGERERDQLKADAAAARQRAAATAEQLKQEANDVLSDKASTAWDEVRRKWKAHVAEVRSNLHAKIDEQDATAAERYADLAENYARNVISFAQGSLQEAGAAALDAVYVRANAIALSSGIARQ